MSSDLLKNKSFSVNYQPTHGNLVAEGQNGALYTFSENGLTMINSKGFKKNYCKEQMKGKNVNNLISNCDHTLFLLQTDEELCVYEIAKGVQGDVLKPVFNFYNDLEVVISEHENQRQQPKSTIPKEYQSSGRSSPSTTAITKVQEEESKKKVFVPNQIISLKWSPYSPHHIAVIQSTPGDVTLLNVRTKHYKSVRVEQPRQIAFGSNADPWLPYCVFVCTNTPGEVIMISGLIPNYIQLKDSAYNRMLLSLPIKEQIAFKSCITIKDGVRYFCKDKLQRQKIEPTADKKITINSKSGKVSMEDIAFDGEYFYTLTNQALNVFKISEDCLWNARTSPKNFFSFMLTASENPTFDFIKDIKLSNAEAGSKFVQSGKTYIMHKHKIDMLRNGNLVNVEPGESGKEILGFGCVPNEPAITLISEEQGKATLKSMLKSRSGIKETDEENIEEIRNRFNELKAREKAVTQKEVDVIERLKKLAELAKEVKEMQEKQCQRANDLSRKSNEILKKAGVEIGTFSNNEEIVELGKKSVGLKQQAIVTKSKIGKRQSVTTYNFIPV